MLRSIAPYKEELVQRLDDLWIQEDPRYRFYFTTTFRDKMEFPDSDGWHQTCRAVVGPDGRLIGYFSYAIDRDILAVHGIHLINFEIGNPIVMLDFMRHIKKLWLRPDIQKISWSVVVGNPAEAMYDKIAAKHGAKVVGTKHREIRLRDGALYDHKFYELLKEIQ